MLGKAIITDRLGDTEAAVELLQETIRQYRQTRGGDYTNLGITLMHLGNLFDTLKRFDESEAAYLEAYEVLERSLGPENGWTSGVIPYLVKLYERTGRDDQAAVWREKMLDSQGD